MIRWNEDPPLVFEVPRLDDELIDDLFYQEDEIGEMRHTAFMIECGLEEDPPDGPDVDPVPWTKEQLLQQQKKQQKGKSPSTKQAPKPNKDPASPTRKGLERTTSVDNLKSPRSPNRRKRLVATKSGSLPKQRTDRRAISTPANPSTEKTEAKPRTGSSKNAKKMVSRTCSADDIEIVLPDDETDSPTSPIKRGSSSSAADMSPRRSRLVATKSGTLHGMRAAAKKAKEDDNKTASGTGDGDDDKVQPPRTSLVATKSGTLHGMRRARKSDIVPGRSNSGKVDMMAMVAEQLRAEQDANGEGTTALAAPSSKPRARPNAAIRATRTFSCSAGAMKSRRGTRNGVTPSSSDDDDDTAAAADATASSTTSTAPLVSPRSTPRRGSGLVQTRSGTNLKKVRKKEKESTGSATDAASTQPSASSPSRGVPARGSGLVQTRSGTDLKKTRRKDRDLSNNTKSDDSTSKSAASTTGTGSQTPRSASDSRRVKRQDRSNSANSNSANNRSSGGLSYVSTSSGESDLPAPATTKKIVFKNGKRVSTSSTKSIKSSATTSTADDAKETRRIVFKNGKRVVLGGHASDAKLKPSKSTSDDDDGSSSESSISQSSENVSISTSEEEDDSPVSVTLNKWKKPDSIKTSAKTKPRSNSDGGDGKKKSSRISVGSSGRVGSAVPKRRAQSSMPGTAAPSKAAHSPRSSKAPLSIKERMNMFQSKASSSSGGDSNVPAAFRNTKKISMRKPKSAKSDFVPR